MIYQLYDNPNISGLTFQFIANSSLIKYRTQYYAKNDTKGGDYI